MGDRLHIKTLTLGPFQANCFLARGPEGPAVVIDPGAEPELVAGEIASFGEDLVAILLTHAHVDHVGAVAGVVRRFQVPVYLHREDLPLYENAAQQAAMFGLQVEPPPPPDVFLHHGERLRFGDLEFEVRHAPGHSPGGVVFAAPGAAFVGDCVFAGSIGRTDLPGGDARSLLHSIRSQILTLPPTTELYTGHGPSTTVAREARTNPFLVGDATWWTG